MPDNLFAGHYVETKVMYVQLFDDIPQLGFIGELDMTKALELVEKTCLPDIVNIYQHTWFDYNAGTQIFNTTLFVLKHRRMVELTGGYCQVLFPANNYHWATGLIKELAGCRIVPEPVKETRIIGFAQHKDLI